MSEVITTQALLLLRQLPPELLMEIFKYLPRDYIPDNMWLSLYFTSRWSKLHIRIDYQHCFDQMLSRYIIRRLTYEDNQKVRQQRWDTEDANIVGKLDETTLDSQAIRIADYHYLNGNEHGAFKDYKYPSGMRRFYTSYRHGKLHGKRIEYTNDGQIKSVDNYYDGKRHGLHRYICYIGGETCISTACYDHDRLVWSKFSSSRIDRLNRILIGIIAVLSLLILGIVAYPIISI